MDKLNELSTGAKITLGAALAFLLVSFFNWQEVDLGPIGDVGTSMWDGIGLIAGLLAIALIVWLAIRLAGVNVELPATPAVVTAALAALLLLFTVIKFLVDNEFRTFWAWLGLILAILVAVGAWLNMQTAGESIGGALSGFGGSRDSADSTASSGTTPTATTAPVTTDAPTMTPTSVPPPAAGTPEGGPPPDRPPG